MRIDEYGTLTLWQSDCQLWAHPTMFFKRRRERQHWDNIAAKLYSRMIQQARLPYFYTELNVADTQDGRFDLLALHVGLLVRRLGTADLTQALVDLMFADMDANLRESGVSDLGVGRRVRKLAEAFYGRLQAYGSAIDQKDTAALVQALCRNLYGRAEEPAAGTMALYTLSLAQQLADHGQDDLFSGHLTLEQP